MGNEVIKSTLKEASVIPEKLNELFFFNCSLQRSLEFNTIEVFIGDKYEEWSHVEVLLEEGDLSGEISS